MITEVKTYYCENVPNTQDIKEGIKIARTNNCLVVIQWHVYQGSYQVLIYPTDTVSTIENKIPRVYGI